MKLGHAAALALVGWYLIGPPMLKAPVANEGENTWPTQYDYAAPLSQWNRGGTYFSDRVKCEDYKCKSFKELPAIPDPELSIMIEAMERSFCINEDDPRLKPNGGPPWAPSSATPRPDRRDRYPRPTASALRPRQGT